MISRRRLLAATAGASLASPAIFGLNAVAQIRRGDELVVGIWGGAQERITRQHIVRPLEERHGVKINYVLGGTPERRARAYQERGRPSFDLIYLNIFESRQAVRDGVTQAPNNERVANARHLFDVARMGGYGVAFNPVTVVYDKRKGKIESWKDLWKPEWKGRIAWPSFPGAQGTSALLMSAKIWGGTERNIDPGFQKIRELKPFAAIQGSQDQLYTMFDQGVADISVEFGSFTRSYAESRNPNIEIANPSEGQVIAMNVACPTVGTRNQALVEAFVDLHLGEACQMAYAREIYYSPTVRNLTIPADLAPKLVLGADVGKLVDFDWDHVIAQQAAWTTRFNREIAG